MRTITFYSYKGGVGRTLTAANFALYLAKLGQTTVVLDFDLEAPGMDSKFSDFVLPTGQEGLVDRILEFQESGEPIGNLKRIALEVPVKSLTGSAPLWLIPAGDYTQPEYYKKVSRIDWNRIFSPERDGVAFFQDLLRRTEGELGGNFAVVDSRTGIGEIAGLCTQHLADEVVALSSLSGESIKMTRRIAEVIRESQIASHLGKSIDVKIVVARVPKPEDLSVLQEKCSEYFGVDETKLFFLFSRPSLEAEEFLAIADPGRDEDLVDDYVRLFYGLDIELAGKSIRAEIDRTVTNLLSLNPEEVEKSVVELGTLYPHPDVYRTALRFFRLKGDRAKTRTYGLKLLDLLPSDAEAARVLAKSYLDEYKKDGTLAPSIRRSAVRAIEPVWRAGELKSEDAVYYADILEDVRDYARSHEIARSLMNSDELEGELRHRARAIAARTAIRLGKTEIATELVGQIPPERLRGSLAALAIGMRQEAGDPPGAFEIAKNALRRDLTPTLLEQAASLARQLGKMDELEETIRSSDGFVELRYDTRTLTMLRSLGLSHLARDLMRGRGR